MQRSCNEICWLDAIHIIKNFIIKTDPFILCAHFDRIAFYECCGICECILIVLMGSVERLTAKYSDYYHQFYIYILRYNVHRKRDFIQCKCRLFYGICHGKMNYKSSSDPLNVNCVLFPAIVAFDLYRIHTHTTHAHRIYTMEKPCQRINSYLMHKIDYFN